VASPTAFQLYVGDGLVVLFGEISVALPGGIPVPIAKARPSLQGPQPMLFQVRIHQVCCPVFIVMGEARTQVPAPLPQPASAAVYQFFRIGFPDGPFTHK
jgi:hypothetical protein